MEEPYGPPFVKELLHLCFKNAEHFEKDDTENGQRLRLAFLGIIDHVNAILPLVAGIEKVMSAYDYDDYTPGNGYRSFVLVVNASFNHALELSNYVAINKESLIFRKGFYLKEIEAVSHMIASLVSCFKHLCTLLSWSEVGELFPSAEHYSEVLLQQSDSINQYAFYGRCLGIQFSASVQPLLKMISIFMASFSEMYYNIGSFSARAQGLFTGGKFLLDPELRAQRIVNISQNANIDFCKSFWFLTESELMKRIPDFMCCSVAVNSEIQIPPEPLEINNTLGSKVQIPIPSSHIPISSIQVRLISSCKREGMIAVMSESKTSVSAPSKSLILHCHGGGFVAQSSKSHEVYLRDWACSLNVPIVSVDYSLAPEAPFPRALEEVFYSYCWVLKNSHILGSTGENIILAGDSAGGNLILGTALKCIEYNIRPPNGIFVAYVPVIVSFTASPSRLLCLMDPLLPIGFLLRCLKAYACPDSESNEKIIRGEDEELNCPESKVAAEGTSSELRGNLETDKESNPMETTQGATALSSIVREKDEELEIGIAYSPKLTEIENGQTEKNYKNAFNTMKKKVSNLVTNTFKLETKNINEALIKNGFAKLSTDNSFRDIKFSIPNDPYLSPYWAPDEMLRRLPPTSICSVEFDPCLDDCVMFAKKLKKLRNEVTLDILEGLPHGFLNLSKVNKDAEKGSKFCIEKIKKLLERADSNWSSSGNEVIEILKDSENHVAVDS